MRTASRRGGVVGVASLAAGAAAGGALAAGPAAGSAGVATAGDGVGGCAAGPQAASSAAAAAISPLSRGAWPSRIALYLWRTCLPHDPAGCTLAALGGPAAIGSHRWGGTGMLPDQAPGLRVMEAPR